MHSAHQKSIQYLKGVGEKKAARYGKAFLDEIRAHRESK